MADTDDRARHWDAAYQALGIAGVSWFQPEPTLSLELIERLGITPDTAVIDIGGGASSLVDHLLNRGFTDVSVLDISKAALEEGRRRVGTSSAVTWLHEDLLSWGPSRRFGLWHDRAVFHFLTDEADRNRYVELLASRIEAGGALIMATFAKDGPEYCSGFRVARYSSDDLVNLLGSGFHAVEVRRELHTTPGGVVQPFTCVAARAAPEKSAQRDSACHTPACTPSVEKMRTLLILNDASGTERSYNGLPLAGALAKRADEQVRVFLLGDAVTCAMANQRVPDGYYHLDRMIESAARAGAEIGCCGSCLDARGIGDDHLTKGTRRSTLEELADWSGWADKVVTF